MINKKYRDIINTPRPISKKHPPMSMENRAAQFSSFAALKGHKEKIADKDMELLSKTGKEDSVDPNFNFS